MQGIPSDWEVQSMLVPWAGSLFVVACQVLMVLDLTEICFSYQKIYVIKEIVSNGQEIIGKASDFEECLMVCVFKSCDLFLVAWRNGAKCYFNS